MSISTTTSALGIVQLLTSQLQSQETSLSELSTQLATGAEYSNLTDYSPTDALNLLNLQDSITQKQSYIDVINAVQPRLSGYDTTMTDMESVVQQAQTLLASDGNYSTANASNMAVLAANYLQSMTSDLNQQINGRYIYAGSRYDTAPVATDLASTAATPSSTIYTDGQTLPSYDSGNMTTTISSADNTITIGGTVNGTSSSSQTATISINGTPYTYTIPAADTTTAEAATYIAAQLSTSTSLSIMASNGVISVPTGNSIDSATSTTTDSTAYATDSAPIDSGNVVTYGVSSDNPAFQQIIAGLQYMAAAGASTDQTTYQANITEATSLLTSGLSALQTLNSSVAYNVNLLTTEQTNQTSAINSLTDQLDNIQQVNTAQVSTEITALETQLQASYSVTGSIEKMSIVNYL